MLTYFALALRAFGVFALIKGALWSADLMRVLYWMHQANSEVPNISGTSFPTPMAATKLNLLVMARGDDDSNSLGWDLTLHTFGWLLLGCFCWSCCEWLARLFLRDIPGVPEER